MIALIFGWIKPALMTAHGRKGAVAIEICRVYAGHPPSSSVDSSCQVMVKFVISPEIQQLISEYNTAKKLSEADDGYIQSNAPSIEHLQLVNISSPLQAVEPSKSQYSLNSLLKTTTLYIQPIEKPKHVCPRYFCINGRTQNIKREWMLCGAASSNKNTTP